MSRHSTESDKNETFSAVSQFSATAPSGFSTYKQSTRDPFLTKIPFTNETTEILTA